MQNGYVYSLVETYLFLTRKRTNAASSIDVTESAATIPIIMISETKTGSRDVDKTLYNYLLILRDDWL